VNTERHEAHRIDALALAKLAVVFATTLVLVLILMYALWQRVVPHYPAIAAQDVPPTPRLQAVPRMDRLALNRAQHARLTSYGWVNQTDGVAHIPIERAMNLLAAQHSGTPR
jgi:hypothetical protein